MSKSVIGLSAALLIALVGAYFSWTVEVKDTKNQGVTLIEMSVEDVQGISYSSEEFTLQIAAKSDALGTYYWAETSRVPKPKKDEKEASAPDESQFKVGAAIDGLLSKIAPFVAVREIEASEESLEEFGLKPPTGTLTLKTPSGEHAFEIGKEGYGHRNVYARDTKTKKYYLLDGKMVRSVKRADNRLLERRMADLEIADLEGFTIQAGDSSVSFTQKNASDPAQAFWTEAGKEEKHMGSKIWIGKVLRSRAISYESADLAKGAKSALKLHLKGKKQDYTVELMRAGEGTEEAWYARSEFTRGLVKLPTVVATDIVQDIETLGATLPPGFEAKPEPIASPASAPVKDGLGQPEMKPDAPQGADTLKPGKPEEPTAKP